MGIQTGIAWTDHSWSPWHGCQHAKLADGTPHPGCLNCYAEAMAPRNPKVLGVWGPDGTRVLTAPAGWKGVRGWNKRAEKKGVRESVFPSICDPFEDWQGQMKDHLGAWHSTVQGACEIKTTLESVRRDFFRLIDETPWLDWLLLTKRPQNIRRMWGCPTNTRDYKPTDDRAWHRKNVRLLYSASDQKSFDSGAQATVECHDLCAGTGFSLEPLKGWIDLSGVLPIELDRDGGWRRKSKFGEECRARWGIIGVESDGIRVGSLGEFSDEDDWWDGAHSIVDQLLAAGVAVFFKQGPVNGRVSHNPAEWPEWARIQQFPTLA